MAIVGLNEAAAAQGGLSPLGSATPGGMSNLLEILRLVNDIVHSPLAASMAARFPGNQGQGNMIISSPIQSTPPAPEPAAPPAGPAAPVINEQMFMQYLASPAGREKIAAGLEQVQSVAGADLTISQMIQILRSGNPLDQKPAEKK